MRVRLSSRNFEISGKLNETELRATIFAGSNVCKMSLPRCLFPLIFDFLLLIVQRNRFNPRMIDRLLCQFPPKLNNLQRHHSPDNRTQTPAQISPAISNSLSKYLPMTAVPSTTEKLYITAYQLLPVRIIPLCVQRIYARVLPIAHLPRNLETRGHAPGSREIAANQFKRELQRGSINSRRPGAQNQNTNCDERVSDRSSPAPR